jgi:hypothetical protein
MLLSTDTVRKLRSRLPSNFDVYAGGYEFVYDLDATYRASSSRSFSHLFRKRICHNPFYSFSLNML